LQGFTIPEEVAMVPMMSALRKFTRPVGDFMLPHARSMKEATAPEFVEKRTKGPVIIGTVMPSGAWGMGSQLAQWFVYSVLVSALAAYVAGRAVGPGADYLSVFRFAGTTAFAAYSMSLPQTSIWYKRSWSTTLKTMFDGLIYGALTAGVFGWLWPKLAS
jgi:hypothetical protein